MLQVTLLFGPTAKSLIGAAIYSNESRCRARPPYDLLVVVLTGEHTVHTDTHALVLPARVGVARRGQITTSSIRGQRQQPVLCLLPQRLCAAGPHEQLSGGQQPPLAIKPNLAALAQAAAKVSNRVVSPHLRH
jgi:hypothetical protein